MFPLPEVEFKPNEPYWFVCEVDRASSAENAYWNYPFLESEPVAYRLIGDFDSVPMQRPAKLDESKSGATALIERGRLIEQGRTQNIKIKNSLSRVLCN